MILNRVQVPLKSLRLVIRVSFGICHDFSPIKGNCFYCPFVPNTPFILLLIINIDAQVILANIGVVIHFLFPTDSSSFSPPFPGWYGSKSGRNKILKTYMFLRCRDSDTVLNHWKHYLIFNFTIIVHWGLL